jgi:tetrapyrrole methylase family protein / MazG family protein
MSTPSRRAGKEKERKRRRKNSAAPRVRTKTEPGRRSAGECFEKLVALQARLRAPNGCPWDREQTHASLRTYLLEEAYEVLEALEAGNDAKFAEEMGDLLLQIVFHSQIAGEEGRFTVSDVIRGVHEKMVRRHPHVFGKTKARTAKAVLKNWEQLKAEERRAERGKETKAGSKSGSLLDGVPKNVPATLEAFQLTRRAARIGFDWENIEGLLEKWREETAELKQALDVKDAARIEEEAGDLLFVAVNLARHLQVDPEIALKKANRKFAARFRAMEKLASEKGSSLAATARGELEEYWEEAKRGERSAP